MAVTPTREGTLHTGHRQRMKERLLQREGGGLSPHELTEMLLYYGIPRRDTNELAHRLMARYGTLNNLLQASYEELMAFPGMIPHAAALILLLRAVVVEIERERIDTSARLDTVDKMGRYLVKRLAGAQVEQGWLLCMDNQFNKLADGMLSEGCANATEIDVRQAVQLAVRCNATVAVLCHNHPRGKTAPSRGDIAVTRQMIQAMELVGITLLDHIIVAGSDYSSMRESPLTAPLFG